MGLRPHDDARREQQPDASPLPSELVIRSVRDEWTLKEAKVIARKAAVDHRGAIKRITLGRIALEDEVKRRSPILVRGCGEAAE